MRRVSGSQSSFDSGAGRRCTVNHDPNRYIVTTNTFSLGVPYDEEALYGSSRRKLHATWEAAQRECDHLNRDAQAYKDDKTVWPHGVPVYVVEVYNPDYIGHGFVEWEWEEEQENNNEQDISKPCWQDSPTDGCQLPIMEVRDSQT